MRYLFVEYTSKNINNVKAYINAYMRALNALTISSYTLYGSVVRDIIIPIVTLMEEVNNKDILNNYETLIENQGYIDIEDIEILVRGKFNEKNFLDIMKTAGFICQQYIKDYGPNLTQHFSFKDRYSVLGSDLININVVLKKNAYIDFDINNLSWQQNNDYFDFVMSKYSGFMKNIMIHRTINNIINKTCCALPTIKNISKENILERVVKVTKIGYTISNKEFISEILDL